MTTDSVLEDEVSKFNALAEEWWNPSGKFRPLHMMNPVRMDYINSQVCLEFDRDLDDPLPYEGLDLLDVGCGGGLLTEPMTRLGANVLGIDVARNNVEVAKSHAASMGLEIRYENISVEDLALREPKFNVVLCMEVLEHVNNPQQFLQCCQSLLQPGGLLIASTINRNLKSFFMAILGAEYILRWLPVGTHDWNRFIKPEEMKNLTGQAGLSVVDTKGFVFNPLLSEWSVSSGDFDVNYVTTSVRDTD